MHERIAALNQEFERIVETGGIRLALIGDRPELADVVAKKIGGDRSLPCRHPIEVAAQRVDLAVMRNITVWMRQRPGRKGVRRKALMHERKRRFEERIGEVFVIDAELSREQKSLVNEGARGQRDGIKTLHAAAVQIVDRVRNHLAQNKEPPLE